MILPGLNIALLLVLIWTGVKLLADQSDRKIYYLGLSMRVAGALSFAFVYLFLLPGGDTIYFFEQAGKLADLAKSDFSAYIDYLFSSQYPIFKSEARDGFFIKIVSLLHLFTNGNYWLITLNFAIISFFPTWHLVNTIWHRHIGHKSSLIIGFLLLPSPIFWTSGLLKDSLVVPAAFFIATLVFKIYHNRKWRWYDWIGLIVSLFLIWKLRYFVFGLAASFLMLVCAYRYIIRKVPKSMRPWLWGTLIVFAMTGVSSLNQNLSFSHFPLAIYNNQQEILTSSESHEALKMDLKPSWVSIMKAAPKSLFAGLFQPVIGQGKWFLAIHWVENLFILFMVIFSLVRSQDIPKIHTPGTLMIFFILLMATTFPLASPNFGTLMRYKAIYLPCLFYLSALVPIRYWLHLKQSKT